MKKKCDVLYIHSTKNPIGEDNLRFAYMPMGIIGILNNIKSLDIDVYGINFAIEKTLNPNFNMPDFLAGIEYKVLLTDLHWYEHSFGAMYVVEESKKAHPNTPTVIGGYTSTIYAEEIMKKFNYVDFVVTGDSDLPMEMLIKYILKEEIIGIDDIPNILYRDSGKTVKAKKTWVQESLDDIDFVNVDFFEHSEKVPYLTCTGVNRLASERWIGIARGCKFNCAYCCGANKNMQTLFNRCNILLRSSKKVAEDFIELTKQEIYHIAPSHDLQMFGEKYYKEVFSTIREANIKPGMYLECFQLPTKDFIDEVAETFDINRTILAVSPISGNEELRKKNGKLFTNDDFYKIVNYIISKKIPLQLYYTLNIVDETKEEFMDTYFQMKYLRMMFNLGKKHVFYQHIVIDPLAGMRDFENINVTYNTFMDYYNYCLIPHSQNDLYTGYRDVGEVPNGQKRKMFEALF